MKAVVVLLLALAAVALAVPFHECGRHEDLHVSSVDVSPVAPGKEFTVTVKGKVLKAVPSGHAHLEVFYLGVKIVSHEYDLCKLGAACPIEGEVAFAPVAKLPASTPRGKYTGRLVAFGHEVHQILCVEFPVEVTAGLDDLVNDDAVIESINNQAKTWVAGRSARFNGVTYREAHKLLGLNVLAPMKAEMQFQAANDIPETFDSRQQWPSCIHPIRDQAHCGSCWAFALTEVMSDRFCISTSGSENVVLSPQYVLSCDKSDMCCSGGYLDRSWNFMATTGTVVDSCWPYESGDGSCPACRTTCKDGSELGKRYRADSTTVAHLGGVSAIQTDIMTYGPIEGGFYVYSDFYNYQSGVYKHVSGGLQGGHAIKILGWGVENGTPYWLCANSWGTSWAGLGGFFKILRGSDECYIESMAYSGRPLL